MQVTTPKTVVMVAGEASGDLHGAHVIRALRKRHGNIYVCGAGGSAMRAEGAKLVVDADELSVMGFTAIFSKAPQLLKALSKLKHLFFSLKPDLVIFVDFPDFNIHLAASAKKAGIPVLYYISPTIWAWRANRIKKIKQRVDHMAVILPFEESIYRQHDVPVSFVGHPLLDDVENPMDMERTPAGLQTREPTIALMPGSRRDEVRRLLPTMLKAAQILHRSNPHIRFLISCAPSISVELIQEIIGCYRVSHTQIMHDNVNRIFKQCYLAIVASGTVSLEAAIQEIPTIIIYEVSLLSYWLGKMLVDVPHIGLANLIAGKRVLPELVQKEACADNIAQIASALLTDSDAYKNMRNELNHIRQMLGQPGASDRVAKIACRLMGCDRAI
jgi:lipid-A-disaccharide synthase